MGLLSPKLPGTVGAQSGQVKAQNRGEATGPARVDVGKKLRRKLQLALLGRETAAPLRGVREIVRHYWGRVD